MNVNIGINMNIDITPTSPTPCPPPRPLLWTAPAWGGDVCNIQIDINMHIDIRIIVDMYRQYWYPQARRSAGFFRVRHAFTKKMFP